MRSSFIPQLLKSSSIFLGTTPLSSSDACDWRGDATAEPLPQSRIYYVLPFLWPKTVTPLLRSRKNLALIAEKPTIFWLFQCWNTDAVWGLLFSLILDYLEEEKMAQIQ